VRASNPVIFSLSEITPHRAALPFSGCAAIRMHHNRASIFPERTLCCRLKTCSNAMAFWCEADATSERRFRQAILAGISAGGAFLRHSGKWRDGRARPFAETENGDGRSV